MASQPAVIDGTRRTDTSHTGPGETKIGMPLVRSFRRRAILGSENRHGEFDGVTADIEERRRVLPDVIHATAGFGENVVLDGVEFLDRWEISDGLAQRSERRPLSRRQMDSGRGESVVQQARGRIARLDPARTILDEISEAGNGRIDVHFRVQRFGEFLRTALLDVDPVL